MLGDSMGKLGHGTKIVGSIPIRNEPKVGTPDLEIDAASRYQLIALARVEKHLGGIARQLEDRTKPVDEYQVNAIYSATELIASVEVLPQFEISEQIQSVLITGPVNTGCTLQLGDRSMSLATDATGKIVIAPVAFLLTRNDRRILTSQTPGSWTLELMGYADARY